MMIEKCLAALGQQTMVFDFSMAMLYERMSTKHCDSWRED
jgi:hypothetical protein